MKATLRSFGDYLSPLPSNSQGLDNLLNQSGVGFFDFFFVAQRVEGICDFCLVVLVALALIELAFTSLFFSSLTVVVDEIAKLICSDIPLFSKSLDMLADDRLNHLL